MTSKELRGFKDRAPFKPFTIHLSNGDVLPVLHPEMLSCPPGPPRVECLVWVNEVWNWIDLDQIVRVTPHKKQAA